MERRRLMAVHASGGHCLTGVGQVNLVMTPVGGFGWMLGEDLLDRYVARRVEGSTRNSFLIGFTRCALNPIRAVPIFSTGSRRGIGLRVMPVRFTCRARRANAIPQYSTLDESRRVGMCVVDGVRTPG